MLKISVRDLKNRVTEDQLSQAMKEAAMMTLISFSLPAGRPRKKAVS